MSIEVWVRDPFPPHRRLRRIDVGDVEWEWQLGAPSSCQITAPAAGLEGLITTAPLVTVERQGRGYAGWVVSYDEALRAGTVRIGLADVAGALFPLAHTPVDALAITRSADRLIEEVIAWARAQGTPPLELTVDAALPVAIAYRLSAEPLSQFVPRVVEAADGEWRIDVALGAGVQWTLVVRPRLGRDRSEVVIDRISDGRLSVQPQHYLAYVLAVGGSGDFASRPQAEARRTPGPSPVLSGGAVVVDPLVGRDGLHALARRRLGLDPAAVLELEVPEEGPVSTVEPGDSVRVAIPAGPLGREAPVEGAARVLGVAYRPLKGTVQLALKLTIWEG